MVLLDDGAADSDGDGAEPLGTDIGRILTDPAEFERRLARIRKASAGAWEGDEGRKRFRDADRSHAEAGLDLVRTEERPRQLSQAQAHADEVARTLDQAITADASRQAKLRMLDLEIAKLQGRRDEVQATTGRSSSVRMLEQSASPEPASSGAEELDQRVRERLRLLGKPENHYVIALEAEVRGDPMPTAETPPEPAVPPGVHPEHHLLDRRARARMKELGRPDSEYPRTLDEILQEHQ